MPAGGSSKSGGFSHLPEKGDKVWVRFLDGEPEKPIWEWAVQSDNDHSNLKLNEYTNNAPDRAIWTRYGHSIELKTDSLVMTTKEGYQLLLQESTSESGGQASIQTPKGQRMTLNDLNGTAVIQSLETGVMSAKTVILNAATSVLMRASERLTMMVGSTMISVEASSTVISTASGATFIIDESGNVSLNSAGGSSLALEATKAHIGSAGGTGVVCEATKLSMNAPQFVMNSAAIALGTQAQYQVMMLTPAMLEWITAHTHYNGKDGEPTGTPIGAPPLDTGSLTTRTI
jgi:hypothetical protein